MPAAVGAGPQACDLVIVGAGVVGCAAAYHAARRGASVRVLDRGTVAGEQSSRAWGFVRQQGRHPAEVPLAVAARHAWETLEDELDADLEFIRAGILVPGESAADEQRLNAAARTASENGLDSQLIGAEDIRRLLPSAVERWRVGLFTSADGHAEPVRTAQAFAEAARRLGVVIEEGATVLGLRVENGRATGVVTREGVRHGGAILCAAGIGTADLCRTASVHAPIQIVRASVAQTRPAPAANHRSGVAVWAPHVAFRPKRDGSFYIGNGYRGIDAEHDLTLGSFRDFRLYLPTFLLNRGVIRLRLGREAWADAYRRLVGDRIYRAWPEPAVNHRLVRLHERRFYEVYPQLAGLGIERSWAGRIDTTPDLIPIIDRIADPRGLYLAAGFNGHGFALAPAVGKLLAELICTGTPSLDLTRFRLSRFAEGDSRPQGGAL